MPLTYNVMPFPKFFAVDATGVPYSGGLLYAYASGTTTAQDTYSDSIGTPNTNPVQLDSAGRATIYLAPKAYAFKLTDSNGVTIWTVDPVYGFSLTTDFGLCGGRLTLSTGVPVTTADVTAATTVFFTPYKGGALALFDGTSVWGAFTFSEISVAVPNVANQMYDVFASQTAGVVALSVVAWTNDTTRATAITLQNGVYVKSGGTTFRYLGSFRTTAAAGQTEDSTSKRYLWNYANRVRRPLWRFETADTWTYTTATIRQANANTANQVDLVVGVQEVILELLLNVSAGPTGALGAAISAGFGEDSTTTFVAASGGGTLPVDTLKVVNQFDTIFAALRKMPAVGRHFYPWLERSDATGTTVWCGDNGNPTYQQSGMVGSIEG